VVSCGSPPPDTPEAVSVEFAGAVETDLPKIDTAIAEGPFQADWASLEGNDIPDWFHDAKLGIFIHRGVSSVPAFGISFRDGRRPELVSDD